MITTTFNVASYATTKNYKPRLNLRVEEDTTFSVYNIITIDMELEKVENIWLRTSRDKLQIFCCEMFFVTTKSSHVQPCDY